MCIEVLDLSFYNRYFDLTILALLVRGDVKMINTFSNLATKVYIRFPTTNNKQSEQLFDDALAANLLIEYYRL